MSQVFPLFKDSIGLGRLANRRRSQRDLNILTSRWIHTIPFEWITGILPVRYSARVMPNDSSTTVFRTLVHEHAGRAPEVRAIDDDLLPGDRACPECSLFLAAFVIRKGNGNASKRVCVRAIEPSEIHRVCYAATHGPNGFGNHEPRTIKAWPANTGCAEILRL